MKKYQIIFNVLRSSCKEYEKEDVCLYYGRNKNPRECSLTTCPLCLPHINHPQWDEAS
jgi:hypothetical protein